MGVPWGAFEGAKVTQEGLEGTMVRTGGLAKSVVLFFMTCDIWAFGGTLGDLGGNKFLAKSGEGEGNAVRGDHGKQQTKNKKE